VFARLSRAFMLLLGVYLLRYTIIGGWWRRVLPSVVQAIRALLVLALSPQSSPRRSRATPAVCANSDRSVRSTVDFHPLRTLNPAQSHPAGAPAQPFRAAVTADQIIAPSGGRLAPMGMGTGPESTQISPRQAGCQEAGVHSGAYRG
jgi:hypothetical protein